MTEEKDCLSNQDKPNKYSRSKVYKLQCDDGYYYIGSTINSLNRRLRDHKCLSKKESNRRVYEHINEIGWEHVRIILVSEHNLSNKQELLKEEDNVIKNCKEDEYCLNMLRASVPSEEFRLYNLDRMKDYYRNNKEEIKNKVALYRENNREKILETNKKCYEKNCDKVKEKAKEYRIKNGYKVICECGAEIVKYELSRHKKKCKNLNGALNRISIIVSED